jgi:hypothetical protein
MMIQIKLAEYGGRMMGWECTSCSQVNAPGFGAENEKSNTWFDSILPVANVLVYLNDWTLDSNGISTQ